MTNNGRLIQLSYKRLRFLSSRLSIRRHQYRISIVKHHSITQGHSNVGNSYPKQYLGKASVEFIGRYLRCIYIAWILL